MERRIIVSGGNEVREILPGGRRIRLEGSGTLLKAGDQLYVFSHWGNMIWRLDSRRLIPLGLFAGGPGICQMMISRDKERLYALCEEADCLLVFGAQDGNPLFVNRTGVNPRGMAMDETGDLIAVAGGACGEVFLMDSKTLMITSRLETGGMAFDVLIRNRWVYVLSLDETLNSVCTAFERGRKRGVCRLPGMPGTLAVLGGRIAAATHEGIFMIGNEGDRVTSRLQAPGRAGRLFETPEGLAMTDIWSDTLFLRRDDGRWIRFEENVCDAALMVFLPSGHDDG